MAATAQDTWLRERYSFVCKICLKIRKLRESVYSRKDKKEANTMLIQTRKLSLTYTMEWAHILRTLLSCFCQKSSGSSLHRKLWTFLSQKPDIADSLIPSVCSSNTHICSQLLEWNINTMSNNHFIALFLKRGLSNSNLDEKLLSFWSHFWTELPMCAVTHSGFSHISSNFGV